MSNTLASQITEDTLKELIFTTAEERWGEKRLSKVDIDPAPLKKVVIEAIDKHIREYITANLDDIVTTAYPQIRKSIDFAVAEYASACTLAFFYGEGLEALRAKYGE